jgi:hypothetical protein
LRPAVQLDPARRRAVRTVQRLEHLTAAGTHQPGEPDDLAGPYGQVDVVQCRPARLRPQAEALHAQAYVAAAVLGRLAREQLAERTAHHHLDQLGTRRLRHRAPPDVRAVAQHGHRVGDLRQLLQPVGDVDDRHAAAREIADHLEQPPHLGVGQRGRRLVHHEDPDVAAERLGHLDELLLGDAAVPHLAARAQPQAQAGQQLGRTGVRGGAVAGAPGRAGLPAEDDVVRDGQLRHEVQLLVDHGDAVPRGVLRGVDRHLLTGHLDDALVVAVHAGEDVHQRGLARAVLTEQRGHLPGVHGQVDAGQRAHAGEALADAPHAEHDLPCHRHAHPMLQAW